MARMRIYRPGCNEDGCIRSPKWEIVSEDGSTHGFYCGTHAQRALRALSDVERAKQRPAQIREAK